MEEISHRPLNSKLIASLPFRFHVKLSCNLLPSISNSSRMGTSRTGSAACFASVRFALRHIKSDEA